VLQISPTAGFRREVKGYRKEGKKLERYGMEDVPV